MRTLLSLALLASAAAGTASLVAPPALAQSQDRIIDVYGDDKCPSSGGQEIVICKRHPAQEKYRIPKDLREQEPDMHKLPGQGAMAVNTTGQTGVQVNSCNAIGAGVAAGCVKQSADAWKAQQRADKKAEAGVP
jgi:hypothetical protein